MPAIRLSCPTCSQKLSADTDALRSRMSCPRCGAEFLPLDVIPPQMTLPAMPVVRLKTDAGAPEAKAAEAHVGPAATPLEPPAGPVGIEPVAGSIRVGPASAPITLPATEMPADFRAAAETPGPSAPHAMAEEAFALAPAGSAPDAVSRAADPQAKTLVLARKPAARGSTAAEIASLASDLQKTASQRAPWAIGYEHLAAFSALATGLALLVLALVESGALRAIAGVLATLSLTVTLGSAAAYGLARWGAGPRAPISLAGPGAGAGSAEGPSIAPQSPRSGAALPSLSTRARIALAAGALGVSALAVTITLLVSTSTREVEAAPIQVRTAPSPTRSTAAPKRPELPPEQRADYKLKREGHVAVASGVLYAPPSFRSDDGAFDLVVHFHGNTQLVEESVGSAKVNALVLVINAGTGSGPYEERYALPAVFDDALTRVRDAAEKRGLKDAKLRRLALSSWSAGYGAIAKILEAPKNLDRIDALLMMDGLHVAYMDAKTKTNLDMVRLQPFVRFAKEAAKERKLFSITHGDTETYGYASTGEAAGAILREVGADRRPASGSPPRVTLAAAASAMPKDTAQWLEQTTEARSGGLRVRGYVGRSPEHHMAHLIQMSVTVLPDLAEHWK